MPVHPLLAGKRRPLVLGHRGVPLEHQENTLAGFRKAVEFGIDGVELDVYLTRDGRVIVFHDRCPQRLTGHDGDITQMKWDEIAELPVRRQIEVGGGRRRQYPRQERIPLLEEVLTELKGKLLINIELKADLPEESQRRLGMEVGSLVRRLDAADWVFATSVGFCALEGLHTAFPEVLAGFSYEADMFIGIPKWPREFGQLEGDAFLTDPKRQRIVDSLLRAAPLRRAVGSTVVDIDCALWDTERICRFHEAEMGVGAFTLFDLTATEPHPADQRDLHLVERLLQDRVDWIETDDPVQLRQLLSRY